LQGGSMKNSEKEYCDRCKVEENHLSDIECLAYESESISWSELAELTHKTQVMRFGFCLCEEGQKPYSDCPEPRVRVLREVQL
jgi:hypothetical protein